MTCETALRLIDSFVADELAAEDARSLADHLRGCPSCTAEMASASRLVELLATLPDVPPTPDFDERVLLAALEDRRRRHEHRNWMADLWTQVVRGAMRTTGTLVLTIVVVAVLGGAFVFAAANLGPGFAQQVGLAPRATPTPALTTHPTPTPAAAAAVAPTTPPATPSPTPAPTPPPTQRATPAVTPGLTPSPSPSATPTATPAPTMIIASPTVAPSASASATPSPTPSSSPTPKPRRCPPGTACYSPSPSPSAAATTSP
jgi:hypothetical protein